MNDPANPHRLHPTIPVCPHDLSDEEIAGVAGGTAEASVEGLVVRPNANGQMEVLGCIGGGNDGVSADEDQQPLALSAATCYVAVREGEPLPGQSPAAYVTGLLR